MTDSGLWLLRSSAASSIGLYSTTRVGSMPQDAVTIHDRPGVVDARRELGRREAAEDDRVDGPEAAQASIATTASGTIGM